MGRYTNAILAILILIIVTTVASTFFYKRGQEKAWQLAQQLVPLRKGEIYLCVEKTGVNGVSFLTVQEISEATKDQNHDQRELRFRLRLTLNRMNLKEYNDKYRGGKEGL